MSPTIQKGTFAPHNARLPCLFLVAQSRKGFQFVNEHRYFFLQFFARFAHFFSHLPFFQCNKGTLAVRQPSRENGDLFVAQTELDAEIMFGARLLVNEMLVGLEVCLKCAM